MTDTPAARTWTTTSSRRAAALLLAWLAAAVAAGIPDGASATANAKASTAKTPVVQNTGPECFAGHTAPPASVKSGD